MWSPQVVCIVGVPASGKTTLCRTLGTMLETYDAFPDVKEQAPHYRLAE